MTEVVVGPDCEALVIGYLNPLTDESVSSNTPPTQQGIRVTEVPSAGFENRLYRALLSVEFWHPDRVDAKNMALTLLAHLEASPLFHAECSSPGFLPDPDSGTPRYVATVQLWTGGTPI